MRWLFKTKPKWKLWFAWHPIIVHEEYIWLERVYRQWYVPEGCLGADGYHIYKHINEV